MSVTQPGAQPRSPAGQYEPAPRPFRPRPACEAYATWQWFNYLEASLPTTKSMLRVNLDETAVCIFQGGNRGTIFAANTRLRALVEAASTAQRRRYITHVGMICDRPELQPLLPQFLVCNEATITAAELVAIQAACPPNIRLVRQKSAWTNKAMVLATALPTVPEASLQRRDRVARLEFAGASGRSAPVLVSSRRRRHRFCDPIASETTRTPRGQRFV